jgi:hypothetical protein
MGLIQLEGSAEILSGLGDVEGLTLMRATMEQRGVDLWRVGGYASDQAVDTLRARGASVQVVMTTDEVLAARRQQQAEIEQGRVARGEV